MTAQSLARAAENFTTFVPVRPTIEEYTETLRAMGHITPIVDEALAKARDIRRDNRLVFYIAGALTGMSEEVKQRYVDLGELIAKRHDSEIALFGYAPHVHGTDPVKHPNVTPEEVRDVDYLWAAVVPDGHFNFWGPMAHGNAIEAGWAEVHNIPTISIVPEDMKTSRLVRGLHNVLDTIVYTDFNTEGLQQAEQFLDALRAQPAYAE